MLQKIFIKHIQGRKILLTINQQTPQTQNPMQGSHWYTIVSQIFDGHSKLELVLFVPKTNETIDANLIGLNSTYTYADILLRTEFAVKQ